MSYWPETHIAVHAVCIACHSSIRVDEMVLALLGDGSSAAYSGLTKPFPFPQRGLHPSTLEEYMACRRPNCRSCAKSPEAFTVHIDCFKLFRKSCTSPIWLRFLFTGAAWKNPWPRAVTIEWWNAVETEIYSPGLALAAEKYGIPELSKIPIEILYMIRRFSAKALLWRYVSVLELAEKSSTARAEGPVEVPLCRLDSWERGSRPLLKANDYLPLILRLSIDLKGIKRVEHLDEPPKTKSAAGGCFAFIVERGQDLRGVIAQFKDGLLRLLVPVTRSSLLLWDTPCPPTLSDCRFFPRHSYPSYRIRAIDLNEITGLTFFCDSCGNDCYAIHAHTPKMPSALPTFERLADRRQEGVNWIYLPLSSQERIVAIGSRNAGLSAMSDIIIKTSLTRVYYISPWKSLPRKVSRLGYGLPTTLLYDEPGCAQPISAIGVHCAGGNSNHINEELLCPEPPGCPLSGNKSYYYSSASLNNVRSARVYSATEDGYCTGILFEYNDGNQQAVGQCAPYVWSETEFHHPRWLYYQPVPTKFGCRSVFAIFAPAPLQDNTYSEFLCENMEGTVAFWSGSDDTAVLVVNKEH